MEVSSWENHLFLWAITMAMLNNQRVNQMTMASTAEARATGTPAAASSWSATEISRDVLARAEVLNTG